MLGILVKSIILFFRIRQFSSRKQEVKNQVILIYEEKAMKSLLTTREKEKLI